MKHRTGLLASFLVAALLVARPGIALADVVPARKAAAQRDAAAVENRLVALGVDSSTAKAGTDRLTPSELRYYAEDSNRLQNVGGLTWDEIAGGLVFGGTIALFLFLVAVHAKQ